MNFPEPEPNPTENYYVFYREPRETGRTPKNHIVGDDEPLCDYIDAPDPDSLVSVDGMSTEEWDELLHHSNLCSRCRSSVKRKDVVPEPFHNPPTQRSLNPEKPTEGDYIYYRKATGPLTMSPRDHIIRDGEALCDYGVNLPNLEDVKPIEEMSPEEWALILSSSSNMCGDCLDRAPWEEVVPRDTPEPPEYQCPACDEPAVKVDMQYFAFVHHGSTAPGRGTVHKVPREHYEQWRRNPE